MDNHLTLSGKVHCGCCMCPIELWKPSIRNYKGDECELYESFLSLVEDGMTPAQLTTEALLELPKEFSDIEDIVALVDELVDIAIECGLIRVLPSSTPVQENEVEKMKAIAQLAITDNVQQFGRVFTHVAASATIGCMISHETLSTEEIIDCVRFTLELVNALYHDESIPYETSMARLIAGKKKKAKR